MPALKAFRPALGSEFEWCINIDTRDSEKPKNFLKDANLTG